MSKNRIEEKQIGVISCPNCNKILSAYTYYLIVGANCPDCGEIKPKITETTLYYN
jgi:phage FluMu protein Com